MIQRQTDGEIYPTFSKMVACF